MTEGKWMPLRRPIPWGLLGMIGLVWSIEKFEVRRDYALESFHGANWRATAKLVEKSVKDAGILCFGDSLMRDGVYPAVLQEVTGKTAYNLAVPTGPAPASYVLLRRALERGARPSAIVVDFDADVLKEGPRSTRRPYPWADLLTVPEMIDLAWQSRDFEVFARIAVKRLLWSEKNRFEIREAIVAGFRNEVTSLRMNLLGCFRNWKINNGAQVNPIGGITEESAGAGQHPRANQHVGMSPGQSLLCRSLSRPRRAAQDRSLLGDPAVLAATAKCHARRRPRSGGDPIHRRRAGASSQCGDRQRAT